MPVWTVVFCLFAPVCVLLPAAFLSPFTHRQVKSEKGKVNETGWMQG